MTLAFVPKSRALGATLTRFTWMVALVGALLALAVVPGSPVGPDLSPASAAGGVRAITLPIHPDRADSVHWTDTWGAARSGGRSHIGVDMMGEKMTPLVAARAGTVTWGRFDNARGSLVRFRDDQGWEYQYIHLNNDTPGTDDGAAACTQVFSARLCRSVSNGRLARGVRVTEGEVIGYLGDGGNAEDTAPHLHFEVYRPTATGTEPVNPTPVVDAALARLRSGGAPAGAPAAADPGQPGFVDHVWYQLEGRLPTTGERDAFAASVSSRGVWLAAAERIGPTTAAAAIDRLYLAFFQRYPDTDGIRYWIGIRGSGQASEDIAEWFAQSAEFRQRYGDGDFGAFLDQLYRDVLGREPDAEGRDYWLGLLDRGEVDRGTIVVYFADSDEMIRRAGTRNEAVAISLLADGTAPTRAQADSWGRIRAGSSIGDALADWYGG